MSGAAPTGEARAYNRRPLAIGLVAAAIVFAVAAVDLQLTRDELPTASGCPDASQGIACAPPDSDPLLRYREAADLESDYETRLWIYSLTALAMLLAVTWVGYRRTAEANRGEIFRDVGALGVVWLIGGFFATTPFDSRNTIDASFVPLAATAGALLLVAAAGTLLHRGPRRDRPSPTALHKVGLGLVALAVVCVLLLLAFAPPACGYDRPGWVDLVSTIGWLSGLLGALCGVIALIARWWVSALVMLVVGPVAALFAVLASACLS